MLHISHKLEELVKFYLVYYIYRTNIYKKSLCHFLILSKIIKLQRLQNCAKIQHPNFELELFPIRASKMGHLYFVPTHFFAYILRCTVEDVQQKVVPSNSSNGRLTKIMLVTRLPHRAVGLVASRCQKRTILQLCASRSHRR